MYRLYFHNEPLDKAENVFYLMAIAYAKFVEHKKDWQKCFASNPELSWSVFSPSTPEVIRGCVQYSIPHTPDDFDYMLNPYDDNDYDRMCDSGVFRIHWLCDAT